MERKEIVKILEAYSKSKAKYLGPPSFAFVLETAIGTLRVERDSSIKTENGVVVSLEDLLEMFNSDDIEKMKMKLEKSALIPSIDILSVTVPLDMHTGKTLINLINMISSKQDLIFRAFGLEVRGLEDEFAKDMANKRPQTISEFESSLKEVGPEKCQMLTFDFYKNRLAFNIDSRELSEAEINAFMDLSDLMNATAISASHISSKTVSTDNPKYTFRVWILRLGMISERYKSSRAALLSRLPGNSAFRSPKNTVGTE